MEKPHTPLKAHKYFSPAAESKIYRLHSAEKTLAWITALILIFQPWAMGGMRLWSQIPVGILSVIAFLIALLPRNYTDEHHAGKSFRLKTWPKLLRFPIFWLGLIYFGIILIQIANPAWRYVSSNQGWWLERIDYIQWLPHGIADAPATKMNGWRIMLIQGAAWLLVCALWIGITRRKTARILLTTIALNGVVIALVTLAQRFTESRAILWMFDAGAAKWHFAGTFIYKNHTGAYLVLIITLCIALAWWHADHAQRKLQRSHPGMLFVFFVIISTIALLFTYARAATIAGGLLIIATGALYAKKLLFQRNSGSSGIANLGIATVVIGFTIFILSSFNTNSVWKRFSQLIHETEFSSITTRQLAAKATFNMAQDSLTWGHGAGCFRYIFPLYQEDYPEIWSSQYSDRKGKTITRRLYWEHAHNDFAELLAETGIVGSTLMLISVILVAAGMKQHSVLQKPPILIVAGGSILVALGAWVDFPMHNPAVLTTGIAIVTLSIRWNQIRLFEM